MGLLTLDATVRGIELGIVLKEAVQLETLSIVIAHGERGTGIRGWFGAAPNVNEALTCVKDTLKTLEFRICGNDWYTKQFGATRRLMCLSTLNKLEHLTTETSLLVRIEGKFNLLKKTLNLSNLVSLTLVDTWRDDGWHACIQNGPKGEVFAIPWIVTVLKRGLTRQRKKQTKNLKYFRYIRARHCPYFTDATMDSIAPGFLRKTATEFSWADDDLPLSFFNSTNLPLRLQLRSR